MMKIKRLMALGSVVAAMLSAVTVSANENLNGDMTIEEGGTAFVETSEIRRLRMFKEMELANRLLQDPVNYVSDEGYIILDVTPFQQENGYYCGPATVKQVLHFINGVSYSQDYYADLLGTTEDGTNMTYIPDVLNSEIGYDYYIYDEIDSYEEWSSKISQGLLNEMPPVLDINTYGYWDDFFYETSGHFVNVCIDDPITTDGDGYYFWITDPAHGDRKMIEKTTLFQVNYQHFRRAFIW